MQPKLVKSYIPTIDKIVNEFLENIESIQDANNEMPGNFYEYLNRWSLESITAIALEKRLGLMDFNNNSEVGERITKAVRKILALGIEFEMKPSVWKIYETKQFKELMNAYNELTE
jgi:cytochrome P450 family 12